MLLGVKISSKSNLFRSSFTANFTLFFDYSFNAKEKDYETGFHYYGSRYYSSELSIWNSTDPMADKYPSLTPYNYCANNPIKLIDPNGEEIWTNNEGWHRIRNAIKSTLGNNAINDGNDEDKTNPFSFNGYKLNFQENKEFYNNLNEEQKIIFDNIKELVTNQTSSVLVQVVDKIMSFMIIKVKKIQAYLSENL